MELLESHRKFTAFNAEKKMLEARFGEQYKIYLDKTWRLVAFVY